MTETLESSSLSEWLATATVRRSAALVNAAAGKLKSVLQVQGYCVLAGACVRSIPQIIRIQRTQRCVQVCCSAQMSGCC